MPQSTGLSEIAPTFEKFLLDHGFVTQPVFERLQKYEADIKASGKGVVDPAKFLVAEKILDEEDVAKARAAFFNLPYIDLRKMEVPPSILSMIPRESTTFYNFAPFALGDNILKVALTDPANLSALQALEFLGQKQNVQIQLFLASSSSLDAALGKKKNLDNVVGQALKDFQTQEASFNRPQVQVAPQKGEVIEDAPIIKIVDVMLTNAIEANASDIHIEPSDTDVRIRYRIDGILHTSLMLPKHVHAAIISRIKILSNLKIDESRLPQDGRFHFETEHKKVDLRVSILPLIYGEKVVMRILDKTSSVPTLEQLGLRGKALEWIMENIKKTHGIFLITGPTGSGKSTTLYSILSILNTAQVNIVTLEDPVEYFIEGVNQSQINPDIGLTFAAGLRSILRQDPNIVMVGEVRDKETAELAVHAALTGHLVFSTLHTNSAIGAMPRLIDMEIEPFLLVASVNVVAAQRLVRKICENCRKPQSIPPEVEAQLKKEIEGVPAEYLENIDINKLSYYKGEGCEQCERTGYRGRFGIFEVLPMIPEIQNMILSKASNTDVLARAAKLGMITMRQDGIIKVLRGETTLEEIVRVTKE
jgi:type IV pilus assembly protein PilB